MFPCGITSTMSHLYVLLCVLPLVIRKSEDSAIWKFLREKTFTSGCVADAGGI